MLSILRGWGWVDMQDGIKASSAKLKAGVGAGAEIGKILDLMTPKPLRPKLVQIWNIDNFGIAGLPLILAKIVPRSYFTDKLWLYHPNIPNVAYILPIFHPCCIKIKAIFQSFEFREILQIITLTPSNLKIKPKMLSGVQTGNGAPIDRYNLCGIAHARTNRKDDIFNAKMTSAKLYIYIGVGQGTCLLTKHPWRWAYSRYFFPACCLLRFAAFLKKTCHICTLFIQNV